MSSSKTCYDGEVVYGLSCEREWFSLHVLCVHVRVHVRERYNTLYVLMHVYSISV